MQAARFELVCLTQLLGNWGLCSSESLGCSWGTPSWGGGHQSLAHCSGWEDLGGKNVLPQPQETRICVRRFTFTQRVPEEEAAATGALSDSGGCPQAIRSGRPRGRVEPLCGCSGLRNLDPAPGRGRHGTISTPGGALPLFGTPHCGFPGLGL